MGIYTLSFQIGATSEVSPSEANDFVQEFLSATQDSESLPMFVPGIGTIIGIYSGWSTGFGFAAIATVAPGLANIEPLTLLYYSPYGLIELAAYSIAMSRSFHVVYSLVKKVNPITLIKPSLIEIGIVVGLLVFAGLLEDYMIKMAEAGTPLL
jgi:hypothetical protein